MSSRSGRYVGAPGPREVLQTGAGADWINPKDLYERRDYLVQLHRDHKHRIRRIRNIINGNWYTEWPDVSPGPEIPAVSNVIHQVFEHWVSLFSSQKPMIKVPPPANRDVKGGKRAARKRERRLRGRWHDSNMTQILGQIGGDYVSTGVATLAAWANFEEPDTTKRNPYVLRFDPLHTYPQNDSKGNLTELLVARCRDPVSWRKEHPEYAHLFKDTQDSELEEWYWYTDDMFYYCVADISFSGRKKNAFVCLEKMENRLGMIPVWEARHPTADGQRRGMLDQAIGPQRQAHLLTLKRLQAIDMEIFSPTFEYNTIKPEEHGPGSVVSGRSSDAKFEKMQWRSSFDVATQIEQIKEDLRQESAFPQQLQGQPGASIVSARGTQSVQGQIDAKLASAQSQIAMLCEKASAGMLMIDEMFCPGTRTIVGDDRERLTPEAYDPEKDVMGNYEVTVSYGIGLGSDPTARELRLQTHYTNQAISMEKYRDELGYVDDPDKEDIRILRMKLGEATFAGLLQRIAQGEIGPIVEEAWKLVSQEEANKEEVIEKLIEALRIPAQPPQPDPMGMAPQVPGLPPGMGGQMLGPQGDGVALAESLARGGSGGTGGPPSGPGPAMPPVQQLLSGNQGPQGL